MGRLVWATRGRRAVALGAVVIGAAGCTAIPQVAPVASPAPASSPSPVAETARAGVRQTLDVSLPVNHAPVPAQPPFQVKSVESSPLPADPHLAAAVRQGAAIFTDTKKLAGPYVGNDLACTSCHIDGGQHEGALPLVGVAAQFPAYSTRAARLISLEDRIRGCFARSLAGTMPPYDSPELLAVAAYLTWISEGQPEGVSPPWRGQNAIAPANLIPISQLHPEQGSTLYTQKCAGCHGAGGQGDGNAVPPLWGSGSFNDGAGLARVYTLAGFIRYAMPADNPGSLTDAEAQQIAAFIDGQDRPVYPGKEQDYAGAVVPIDAVYYPQRYPQNLLRR